MARRETGGRPGDAYQQYLRDVGWGGYERGHGIGNNDVHTAASPLPLEHYHTTWATRTTQRWIAEHVAGSPQRPFFAWCSYTKPHSPYDPPEPYDRLYDARTFPPPVGGPEDLEGLSPRYREEVNRHFWDTLGPEQIQRARAFYAGNVTLIDHCVGQLRQTLAQLGIARDTVICFTADHGDLLGDHGLFFKANFFRGAWHVPFFLYAPGRVEHLGAVPRFSVSEDVYPTLLSLAGVPLPDPAPSTASTSPATCRAARRPCSAPSGAPRTRSTARARCAGPTCSTPAAPTRSSTTSRPTPASAATSPEPVQTGPLPPGQVAPGARARRTLR